MPFLKEFLQKCKRSKKDIEETERKTYKVGKALLVGINYYGTSSKLNGCINDVKNMYHYLTAIENFDPKNIHILTDERHNFDKDLPTRANIIREIKWLTEDPYGVDKKSDVSLFMHYSGHGSWEWDRKSEEKDRRDETICPVDYRKAGLIKDNELRKLLVEPIKDKEHMKLTALFDCCHSGTVLDLRYHVKVTLDPNQATAKHFFIDENKKYGKGKAEITLFSGSMDKQYSADAYINRQAQGAMTYGYLHLIKQFRKERRNLTYKKFITNLQILLRDKGYDQIPQLSMNHCPQLKNLYKV